MQTERTRSGSGAIVRTMLAFAVLVTVTHPTADHRGATRTPAAPQVLALTQSEAATPELSIVRTSVLASIPLHWRDLLPDWHIEFLGPRDHYRGRTSPESRHIEVYVRPDETFEELAHVTAHELGHAIDVTYLDDAERARFAEARGHTGHNAWWVADGADDFGSGAGDWAESFAWSQTGRLPWFSRLGPPPTAAQLDLMRTMFP